MGHKFFLARHLKALLLSWLLGNAGLALEVFKIPNNNTSGSLNSCSPAKLLPSPFCSVVAAERYLQSIVNHRSWRLLSLFILPSYLLALSSSLPPWTHFVCAVLRKVGQEAKWCSAV